MLCLQHKHSTYGIHILHPVLHMQNQYLNGIFKYLLWNIVSATETSYKHIFTMFVWLDCEQPPGKTDL